MVISGGPEYAARWAGLADSTPQHSASRQVTGSGTPPARRCCHYGTSALQHGCSRKTCMHVRVCVCMCVCVCVRARVCSRVNAAGSNRRALHARTHTRRRDLFSARTWGRRRYHRATPYARRRLSPLIAGSWQGIAGVERARVAFATSGTTSAHLTLLLLAQAPGTIQPRACRLIWSRSRLAVRNPSALAAARGPGRIWTQSHATCRYHRRGRKFSPHHAISVEV